MIRISRITDNLYLSGKISEEQLKELLELKIDLLISMIGALRPPAFSPRDFPRLLWLSSYDTFLTPVPVNKLFQGIAHAVPIIQNQGRVLVFCMEGRHRSVTMAAAILIALGYDADTTMRLIKEQRPEADPFIWYVKHRIKTFEHYWIRHTRSFQNRRRR